MAQTRAMPRKRRRKSRYKTGTYTSPKCKTPVEYRSGWELQVVKYLDYDETVLEFGYECVVIPYVANATTGKVRSYYPDFLITYKDGTKKLVEVKRKDKLNDIKVMKKAKAAEAWCVKQKPKVKYEFWTDTMIEAFTKINESMEPPPPVIPPTLKKQVQALAKKRVPRVPKK